VETFAAARLHLDSWRWDGVPFFIRAGKSMAITATEVLVRLRRPPLRKLSPGDWQLRALPARSRCHHCAGAPSEAPG